MATVLTLPIVTPPLPKSWSAPSKPTTHISAPTSRTLLPTGPAHLAYLRLKTKHNNSFAAHDAHALEERKRLQDLHSANAALNGEDDLGVGDEKETPELLALDPKEWKKQDHYAVLGLSHLRFTATPEQIKVAHRKKVLKHHPDKKAGSTSTSTSILDAYAHTNTNDDAFFKCIQKAHEVLTNPERRRQFDSVDPQFLEVEDDVPTAADFKNSNKDFFKTFAPVFARESRFSRTQPVPALGAVDAPKEEVEGFYDFWYNFDSWRSFEWMDKEVNEGSDSRDDKRYTEKKNKSERARRKKEDTARLRNIVDLTLSLDPRIKRIKLEEKKAREAKKANKSGTSTPKKTKAEEEEDRVRAEKEKAKAEEEEKIEREKAKKAKAAAANAAKKARRQQRAVDGE